MSLLVLSSSDVDAIASTFSPQDLQLLMAQVFTLISSEDADTRKRISMPSRIVIPTLNHTAMFMPAHIGIQPHKISTDQSPGQRLPIPALGGTAVKVVCVPATSDSRGLPATTLVLDEVTGGVKAIVNARNLTALRNAAGSLLSTNLIGPSTPRKLVAFGAGKQIEAHLNLFIRHFPSISHCTIVNRTINARSRCLRETINARFNHIHLHLISSQGALVSQDKEENQDTHRNGQQVEDAVRSADVIICATSSMIPLFSSSWVRTGTHVILIGSFTPAMREVERELVFRAVPSPNVESPAAHMPCLLVDSRKACLEEAGELIDAEVDSHQTTEIGELVPKDEDGKVQVEALLLARPHACQDENRFDGPITMFKSVGIGLQDVAIACAVVERALSQCSGRRIEGYDG